MAATTQIQGTSIALANIKIYANGSEIVSAATTASSIGVWATTIPVQTVGTIITAKATLGSNSQSISSNAITVTIDSSSSGGGSMVVTPTQLISATKTAKNDTFLIVGVVILLIAILLFFKKKTKIAIALMIAALGAFVFFFTQK